MKLTKFTNHTIKVLLFASSKNGDLTTIDEVAKFYKISRNHLMKVVHNLSKRGYVETVRGKNGGFRLARSEETINLGELIQYTEVGLFDISKRISETKNVISTKDYDFDNVIYKAESAYIGIVGKFSLADLEKPSI